MIINTKFNRKDNEIDTEKCIVTASIEISNEEFEYFKHHLLEDFSFIEDNKEKMHANDDGTINTIMILNDENDDGILVDSEGYSYARYSSFIPNAKIVCMMEAFPALKDEYYNNYNMVRDFVDKARENMTDGVSNFPTDEVEDLDKVIRLLDGNKFFDVIGENDGKVNCFSYREMGDFGVTLELITQEEFDIRCAKHMLWLLDAGGEQANFTNCLIPEMNAKGKNLNGALFNKCLILDSDFSNAELCFASFRDSHIIGSNFAGFTAEECDFTDALIGGCDFSNSILTHSNFEGAKIASTNLYNMMARMCLLKDCVCSNDDAFIFNTQDAMYNKEEWDTLSNQDTEDMIQE